MSKLTEPAPVVSIGMPIYNGARYAAGAIESVLSQTYGDFELIISDNASTDATEEICRSFAASDPRIRYIRQPKNQGAAWNFDHVFDVSRGRYFRWAAADDLMAPRLIERCVEILEADEGCVLAYPATIFIDAAGNEKSCYLDTMASDSADPVKRFGRLMALGIGRTNPVYGLIRSDVLAKTGGMGAFMGSDHVLLGELAILGRSTMIRETLFLRRIHAGNSTNGDGKSMMEWYRGIRSRGLHFKLFRLMREFRRMIGRRTELGLLERLGCYMVLLKWIKFMHRGLIKEILIPLYANGRPTALTRWLADRFNLKILTRVAAED